MTRASRFSCSTSDQPTLRCELVAVTGGEGKANVSVYIPCEGSLPLLDKELIAACMPSHV